MRPGLQRGEDGSLYWEEVALEAIAARFGTPCYVYSRAVLEANWRAFGQALEGRPHLVCFAVKANSNLAVLELLARLGAGFDVVSGGELERVLRVGGDPARVVFAGVGKSRAELERALEVGIRCFNVESGAELERLEEIAAAHGVQAPIAPRLNPDIDAATHPYIATGLRDSKFGLERRQALHCYRHAAAAPHLRPIGLACHIGSQVLDLKPFRETLKYLLQLADKLRAEGLEVEHLDCGGGLGIRYRDEQIPATAELGRALGAVLDESKTPHPELLLEPGRAVAGPAGLLLTRVEYLKETTAQRFAIVDAAMNDLLRPALYNAWHEIVEVRAPDPNVLAKPEQTWEVVGPICETGDLLGSGRRLRPAPGALLAVLDTGAYGAVMASNYNSRPRPCEVLVDGTEARLVRRRETTEDLWRTEPHPPKAPGRKHN